MDEAAALALVADRVDAAGDDAAVVGDLVVTTDMLHERTDFPEGITPYTIGWRAVGASLSDVAAMGAAPVGAVAAYGAPRFERGPLIDFLEGAMDVCEAVGTAYVGGDLDTHEELTVTTTAIGRTDSPVYRSGARPGDRVYVTGTLGRTAAGLAYFSQGANERANELFRFEPRIGIGQAVAPDATTMMDSSDGLARSLHQLAAASDVGFDVTWDAIPVDSAVRSISADAAAVRHNAIHVGEDFELVITAPPGSIETAVEPLAEIGVVTDGSVTLDGEPLPNVGYEHGS